MQQRLPLMISATFFFTYTMSLSVLRQFLMRDAGAPIFLISLTSTVNGGTAILMATIWGILSDRLGKRKFFLVLSCIMIGIIGIMYVYASSPLDFVLITVAFSMFSSAFRPVSMALSSEYATSNSSKTRELSFLNLSNSLGMFIGRVILGFTLLMLSPYKVVFVFIPVAFLALIPVLRVREAGYVKMAERLHESGERLLHFLKRNGLWTMYLSAFLRQTGISGIMSLSAIYITENIGLSKSTMGFLSAVNPLVQMPSHLFFARVIGRIGAKKTAAAGMALSALTAVLFLGARSAKGIAAGYMAIGFAFGAFINGSASFVVQNSPETRKGQFLGMLSSSRSLGSTFGPALAGVLASFSYSLMFAVMAFLMLTGCVLTLIFCKDADSS